MNKNENADRSSANHGQVRRDVTETVDLTVKSATLDALKDKIKAHVALLDEEDI